MAFVAGAPKLLVFPGLSKTPHLCRTYRCNVGASRRQTIRADTEKPSPLSAGPTVPGNFKQPKPRTAYVRPDQLLNIAFASFATIARGGSGLVVEGYRADPSGGKLTEKSATLPKARPQLPLRLFEFEACPFCRKVREAVTRLDLDVLVFPCPKNGAVYREYVKEKGGRAMFPYLEDPNTGFAAYESMDIVKYLYSTYGPQGGVVPGGISNTVTSVIASRLRGGKGNSRVPRAVPAKQSIEFYGYEASPFSKIVRERLAELEIAYMYRTTPRGSATRDKLKEITGIIQTPYIVDPNTGISMFESADIVKYLTDTYGPDAPGAVAVPDKGDVFFPPFQTQDSKADENVVNPSLNPVPGKDPALEKYCDDNPEADECRVYED